MLLAVCPSQVYLRVCVRVLWVLYLATEALFFEPRTKRVLDLVVSVFAVWSVVTCQGVVSHRINLLAAGIMFGAKVACCVVARHVGVKSYCEGCVVVGVGLFFSVFVLEVDP
eukprot:4294232-Prorocentrum_lima.AAC.1